MEPTLRDEAPARPDSRSAGGEPLIWATHGELLRDSGLGVYGRLWRHQSGGFLAA